MRTHSILSLLILTLLHFSCYASVDKALLNFALNAYEKGDFQTAIEKLETIFNEYPESPVFPKASMYLGYIYYDMGEYDKAKKYLLVSAKRSSKGSEVWISSMNLLGLIYYDEGNSEKYERIFSDLRKYLKSRKDSRVVSEHFRPTSPNIGKITQPTKKETVSTNYITNYVTNYITNEVIITNQVLAQPQVETLVVTNYITNVMIVTQESLSPEHLTNIAKVKEKVEEIAQKEEDLEELNRLTDVKNRLLKLSEKALIIQEMLQKRIGGKK